MKNNNNKKVDETSIIIEQTEETVEIREKTLTNTVHQELEWIRRTRSVLHAPIPTQRADAFFVMTEEDPGQEEPSGEANVKIRITDVPEPAPSEHAEVNVNLVDGEGNVRVPGRFTGQMLDGCITVGCAVSAGFATKWVLEAPNDSLTTDWMVLLVVMVLNVGIGALAWYAMKRRQQ